MIWCSRNLSLIFKKLIVWSALALSLNAQNPENLREQAVSLFLKLYPEYKISKSTDFLDTCSVDPAKKQKFKLYYHAGILSDAGFDIFPAQFYQFYDGKLLRFVERDLLLIWLTKGNATPHENVGYKLAGKTAALPSLYKKLEAGALSGFSGMDLKTVSNGKKKFYTITLQLGKEKLEVTFPARVDLILGAGWEQLANELIASVKNGSMVNASTTGGLTVSAPKPVIEKRPAHREGLFADIYDTTFISGDSRFYFAKDSSGYHPVDPVAEPLEHLNNTFISLDTAQIGTTKLALKVKKYGQKFEELNVSLAELLVSLAGGKPVFLAFEEHKGRKLVDLFFPDRDLNYFHLFYFEVEAFSTVALQNKTLKGWLYPYIRLDNLHDIDKEFDSQGKPKWKVPIDN